MAQKKNKVKFGLNKVHYAKITGWSADDVPTFAPPVRIPGAVSLASLKTDVAEGDENKSELDIESLEVFENIAYIMAKHADPENVPDNPDDFLERFNTFSIYEILPQLIELWGLNTAVQVESKKNIARLTDR